MDRAVLAITVGFVVIAVGFTIVVARLPKRPWRAEVRVTHDITLESDGPIQAEDLQAVGHLLAAHCEDPGAVFAAIVEQVAKEEAAAELDAALDRIRTEDGAA